MKRAMIVMLSLLALLAGSAALGEGYRVAEGNTAHMSALIEALPTACAQPEVAWPFIEAELEAIRAVNGDDYDIARSIAEHWRSVYLDEGYALIVHDGGERATALERAGLTDSPKHAFVVLGYELENGDMTDELKGRCEAAAAAARSFPSALLVCSGGPTGKNNPDMHTEAGLMRDYLVERCGIDAARVIIDEEAMTTVDNAVNTFAMLEAHGIETMTIVTSTYHQRWGQAIYNAVGAVCEKTRGYNARIVENYCFDTEPSNELFRDDAGIAAKQLEAVLGLSKPPKKAK